MGVSLPILNIFGGLSIVSRVLFLEQRSYRNHVSIFETVQEELLLPRCRHTNLWPIEMIHCAKDVWESTKRAINNCEIEADPDRECENDGFCEEHLDRLQNRHKKEEAYGWDEFLRNA